MNLFWRNKNYKDFTHDEWESLCDGCGKCCQIRLQDIDNGDIALTNISCKHLDLCEIKCNSYDNRHDVVEDCIKITKDNIGQFDWLPATCAYRLVYEGKDLLWWHHLLTGDKNTVHLESISMKGKLVSEDNVDDREEYVIEWVK